MMGALNIIWQVCRERAKLLMLLSVSFMVLYYLALLMSLVIRFGHLPNYVTPYNWFSNVWVIIKSTPSIGDMSEIIAEEWLLEVGYMNYDFGNGISEWSLNLLPLKMLIVFAVGFLISLNILLVLRGNQSCPKDKRNRALAFTGTGGFLVAITNATMSWVVCCATPSWVVGLAMLGLGVSTSLWLEPLGLWLAISGFVFLLFSTFYLAQTQSNQARSEISVTVKE